MLGAAIDRGVEQQLRERGAVAREVLRDDRREVAARAVAADEQRVRVRAELGGVLLRPAERRDGVVDRGGKGMLRRESIVD